MEAGIEVNWFQFSASYTYGISNLCNFTNSYLKTNAIGLSAVVKFGNIDY